MDKDSIAILDKIFAKSPTELTQYDKAFLKARRSYLSDDKKDFYSYLWENTVIPVKKVTRRKKRTTK